MGNIFSGSEIVEIGIQIEKNGRDFYKEVVANSKSEKAKEIFRYLADAEEKHIDVFLDLLASVNKYEPAEAYPEEYFAYMNALASGYVFTQADVGREIGKSVKSDAEAIEIGIKFEKDSILFFDGIKKVVPASGQALVAALLEQEEEHLQKLEEFAGQL
ncbi:MAG: ferritin family protein [Candidatus Tantalella remota]|nr:ferritin family protein [Candidatus Tantalella remota]